MEPAQIQEPSRTNQGPSNDTRTAPPGSSPANSAGQPGTANQDGAWGEKKNGATEEDRRWGAQPPSFLNPHGSVLYPNQATLAGATIEQQAPRQIEEIWREIAQAKAAIAGVEGAVRPVLALTESLDVGAIIAQAQSAVSAGHSLASPGAVSAGAHKANSVTSEWDTPAGTKRGSFNNPDIKQLSQNVLNACEAHRNGSTISSSPDRLQSRPGDSAHVAVLGTIEDLGKALATIADRLASESLITTNFTAMAILAEIRQHQANLASAEQAMRDALLGKRDRELRAAA